MISFRSPKAETDQEQCVGRGVARFLFVALSLRHSTRTKSVLARVNVKFSSSLLFSIIQNYITRVIETTQIQIKMRVRAEISRWFDRYVAAGGWARAAEGGEWGRASVFGYHWSNKTDLEVTHRLLLSSWSTEATLHCPVLTPAPVYDILGK